MSCFPATRLFSGPLFFTLVLCWGPFINSFFLSLLFLISYISSKFWGNFLNFGVAWQCVISRSFFCWKLRNVASEFELKDFKNMNWMYEVKDFENMNWKNWQLSKTKKKDYNSLMILILFKNRVMVPSVPNASFYANFNTSSSAA